VPRLKGPSSCRLRGDPQCQIALARAMGVRCIPCMCRSRRALRRPGRRLTTKARRSLSLMQAHHLSLPAFGFVATIGPIIFKDELPERRRQIAAMPAPMNRSHNVLYARLVPGGNVLQSSPKGFLEADACPVTGDHDRPFDDRRFHRLFSIPVRLYAQVSSYGASGLWFQPDLSMRAVHKQT